MSLTTTRWKPCSPRWTSAGGADLLVNNAVVMDFFSVRSGHPLAKQEREVDIDAVGPLRMIHCFLPGMLERGGCNVNVSSGLAYVS